MAICVLKAGASRSGHRHRHPKRRQRLDYSDAFGHVMIVGTGKSFVGTDDEIDPPGVVAKIPWKNDIVNLKAKSGPLVFRRYTGH
jgi:hypothetical protein